MGAMVGKKRAEWGAHKGLEGVLNFFYNFLLLKTFPKKCVFSFMSG
jgi:hypothetical protein